VSSGRHVYRKQHKIGVAIMDLVLIILIMMCVVIIALLIMHNEDLSHPVKQLYQYPSGSQ